ncbi:hypothetical protein ALP33_102926 [Pseudomonas amygdali pv. lachrymans]|uniref:Uncharacterized protein n=1 Tax=Pseudomonas amygdali pv. lachrymans TaxID=53707 RepID=A0AB37QYM5_PSEAV|nr:Unknown protein sequence [Pseudomonas amygdali pv. lachrymans]RMT19218.1 hypothetical protein ALP54_102884 [Pseudomonas amygdali pv. lachrymans]RMU14128.1 hypothetical protein ALP33_102926 [Pseudomonas amygdali pv. lachrymans]RMV49601.1 hypothetical protein ALP09_104392 [Pseudomonas amygdali pv. lachrymans]
MNIGLDKIQLYELITQRAVRSPCPAGWRMAASGVRQRVFLSWRDARLRALAIMCITDG